MPRVEVVEENGHQRVDAALNSGNSFAAAAEQLEGHPLRQEQLLRQSLASYSAALQQEEDELVLGRPSTHSIPLSAPSNAPNALNLLARIEAFFLACCPSLYLLRLPASYHGRLTLHHSMTLPHKLSISLAIDSGQHGRCIREARRGPLQD